MVKHLTLLLLFILIIHTAFSQDIKVYESFEEFEPLLHNENDTTYVINFWATWCKPCVEEMPGFVQLDEKFRDEKFKLILTSLDFETHLNSKVKPFVEKNGIKAEVVLLADSKAHEWIDKVDKDWAGSIPITIIYNKDFYYFKEGMLSYNELDELITNNLIK